MIPVLGVPVLSRPDLLERMLRSIDHPVDDLVVVDNSAARLGLSHWWLRERCSSLVENVWYLPFPSNLGVPVSWNLIVKATPLAPWWLIAQTDTHFPPGSLARFAAEAAPDRLLLSGGNPAWCVFAIGEQAVEQGGLVDEAIYPMYYEDNDWERSMRVADVPVIRSDIPVHHDNSSTINSGYAAENTRTFGVNGDYYRCKWGGGPGHETVTNPQHGGWSLRRRRDLHWGYR